MRVNTVAPGLIWREGIETAWPDGVARFVAAAPLGRLGQPRRRGRRLSLPGLPRRALRHRRDARRGRRRARRPGLLRARRGASSMLLDKAVFVTGGGRGIGRGIAEALAEAGAHVGRGRPAPRGGPGDRAPRRSRAAAAPSPWRSTSPTPRASTAAAAAMVDDLRPPRRLGEQRRRPAARRRPRRAAPRTSRPRCASTPRPCCSAVRAPRAA